MKLNWKTITPWASTCLLLSLAPQTRAQQTPTQQAEIRIQTRSVDDNGNVTTEERVLQGQEALDFIQQNGGQLPTSGTNVEREVEIRIEKQDKKGKQQQIQPSIDLSVFKLQPETPAANGERPVLGISMSQFDDRVIIEEVIDASAAQAAGLQAGDRILRINDQYVDETETVQKLIRAQKPGDWVSIQYERDAETATVKAQLKGQVEVYRKPRHLSQMLTPEQACERLEELSREPMLGVYINTGSSSNGALVNGIIETSGAANSKLQTGDLIVKIDKASVTNYDELRAEIQKYRVGDRVHVTFEREGKTLQTRCKLSDVTLQDGSYVTILKQLCAQAQTQPAPQQSSDTPQSQGHPRPESALLLDVFPNPAKDVVTLNLQSPAQGAVRIAVTNLDGKELFSEDLTDFNGVYQRQLDLGSYPAGTYLVTVTQGKEVLSKQIILQK